MVWIRVRAEWIQMRVKVRPVLAKMGEEFRKNLNSATFEKTEHSNGQSETGPPPWRQAADNMEMQVQTASSQEGYWLLTGCLTCARCRNTVTHMVSFPLELISYSSSSRGWRHRFYLHHNLPTS